jgi:6-phosphofructokinase 1
MAGICRHLEELRQKWGRKFAIVVVAEGIQPIDVESTDGSEPLQRPAALTGMGNYIAEQIIRCSDKAVDVRVSVLGHTQRGGIPSALDRLMAAAFGKAAVDLVARGYTDQMVTWRNGNVVPISLADVLSQSPRLVNPNGEFVATAEALGIYIGDRTKSQALTVCAPLEITAPL